VDEREQGAVGVSEAEREAPCVVRNVEVIADFETVKRLEQDAQRKEDEQRPPAEAEVFSRQAFEVRHVGHSEMLTGLRSCRARSASMRGASFGARERIESRTARRRSGSARKSYSSLENP